MVDELVGRVPVAEFKAAPAVGPHGWLFFAPVIAGLLIFPLVAGVVLPDGTALLAGLFTPPPEAPPVPWAEANPVALVMSAAVNSAIVSVFIVSSMIMPPEGNVLKRIVFRRSVNGEPFQIPSFRS